MCLALMDSVHYEMYKNSEFFKNLKTQNYKNSFSFVIGIFTFFLPNLILWNKQCVCLWNTNFWVAGVITKDQL